MAEHYDVIIIGTGAGGGTLAHTLAPSGKRILLLERGDFLPREMDNWDPEAVFIDGKYISKDTWYDEDGKPFQPQVHYFVGGATKLYGAALYRLRPAGLRRDQPRRRHLAGLAALLRRLRALVHEGRVALPGPRQRTARTRPRGTGASRTPGPPCPTSPGSSSSSDDLSPRGLPPVPRAVRHPARRGRPGPKSTCIRCTWCDGYPCLVHAKADAEAIAVRPLLDLPNVTLLVNAEVTKLETDADRAHGHRGASCRATASTRPTRATSSSLSAGASNTAKLLLRSASDHHPNGLANGSDQVGRNYMFHNSKAVVALSKEPNDTVFQKTLGLNDFYFGADGLRLAGRQHPDGRQVQRRGDEGRGAQAHQARAALSLAEAARHAVDFWLTTEDLPKPDNRVTARRRRQRPPGLHVDQRRGGRPPVPRAEEDPEPRRHGPAPRAPQELLHAHGHPGRRRRPPGRHLPVRRPTRPPRCSTRTARRTSSTTSTSSTPASSRASAR